VLESDSGSTSFSIPDVLSSCFQMASLFSNVTGTLCLSTTDAELVLARVSQICLEASLENALLAAERDAAGFIFPSEVIARDSMDLHNAGGLTRLILAHHERHSQYRFNILACLECFSDDDEFPVLLPLARSGAVIDTALSFEASPVPDSPPRRLLQQIPHTLAKHVFKLWSEGSVLVLPLSEVSDWPNLHVNNLHWCPKPGTPSGRLLGDCSNREQGSSLNTEEAKLLIQSRYGNLAHPTIVDLIRMIFQVAEEAEGLKITFCYGKRISQGHSDSTTITQTPLLS
jgi:hypothetical protein